MGVEDPESIGDALRESDESCLKLLGTINLLARFSKKGGKRTHDKERLQRPQLRAGEGRRGCKRMRRCRLDYWLAVYDQERYDEKKSVQ